MRTEWPSEGHMARVTINDDGSLWRVGSSRSVTFRASAVSPTTTVVEYIGGLGSNPYLVTFSRQYYLQGWIILIQQLIHSRHGLFDLHQRGEVGREVSVYTVQYRAV